MDQDKPDLTEKLEADIAKKAKKAEQKVAEKAKKATKAEKKLAKQAEKATKEAEKALRKVEKQKRKEAEIRSTLELLEVKTAALKPAKPAKSKPKSASASQLSLGAKLQAVARLARGILASGLLQHGLYAGQEQVLFLLDEHGPLALAELAEKLDVRAPTITKTVTRMEAQGFLSRAVSKEDARSIIISLTPDGRRVLTIGRQIVKDVEKKIFSALDKADCEALDKSLDLVLSQPKSS